MIDWLRVDGARLIDSSGEEVVLRGFGIGGWLNMENFVTGFPGTESLQREALRRALGEEGYERFFRQFERTFFNDSDAEYLHSLGCNSVRLPINYRHLESDLRPFDIRQTGLDLIDNAVACCKRHDLWVILDLHALPGCQNQGWHSDNPTHWDSFWTQRHFQDRVIHLWEVLADRYKDEPAIAGYNPMNEPADRQAGARLAAFYQRLEPAIRAADPRHVLFLDGNTYSTDFSMFTEALPNAVYTSHDYARPGMLPGACYPGEVEGQFFDFAKLESVFEQRTEFQRRSGTPIWIGEFGPQYCADASINEQRLNLLSDQLRIYADHGASWSLWTYKDMGLQGVRRLSPESPYARRIESVTRAKARLGTDLWGGSDQQIRYLLDPLMALFDREFPDFDPYPWGRERWVATLFRHIMLGEPLVSQFEACFRGMDDAAIDQCCSSFECDHCIESAGLADLLRSHLH